MLPRMFGLGVAQANLLITNLFLASFLVAGSMAYLNYAWLVLMLPLGVFGMAVSTAIFPTLARQSAAGERAEMGELFGLTLRVILYLTIPAAIGLIVLGRPIVQLLFERGSFTPALTQADGARGRCLRARPAPGTASSRSSIGPFTPSTIPGRL